MDHYDDIYRIFSPGYVVAVSDHPVLQNLAHPFFKKILTYTDQVVFILNHSTFEYVYISENVYTVFGIPAHEWKSGHAKFGLERIHPDDMTVLNTTVFPEYYHNFHSLSTEQKLRMKSTYTVRFKRANGIYVRVLQHNIPLTIENAKVILGLMVCMDISAYKKDDSVSYKNVLIEGPDRITLLSQGSCENAVLTTSEIRVLQLTANGLSEKEIAEKLSLSVHTVKSHRKNMMRKTCAKNSAELVKYGMANLLI